jgi:hypothetical protein
LPLSGHLGALAGGLGCFPFDNEAYPPLSYWLMESIIRILSLRRFGTAFAARTETVLYPKLAHHQPLRLNTFRGDPASSEFDWNFTPNHSSSADFSTSVGSVFHLVLPKIHPGHG